MDATGYRALIEQELERRVQSAKPHVSDQATPAAATAHACVCGTANDVDAVFCKRCGSRLLGQGVRA
jgi:hypothetical protein